MKLRIFKNILFIFEWFQLSIITMPLKNSTRASWVFCVASLTMNTLCTTAFDLSHQNGIQEWVENHVSKMNCRRERERRGEVQLDCLNAVSNSDSCTFSMRRSVSRKDVGILQFSDVIQTDAQTHVIHHLQTHEELDGFMENWMFI